MFRWVLNISLNKKKFFYIKVLEVNFSNAKKIRQMMSKKHAST